MKIHARAHTHARIQTSARGVLMAVVGRIDDIVYGTTDVVPEIEIINNNNNSVASRISRRRYAVAFGPAVNKKNERRLIRNNLLANVCRADRTHESRRRKQQFCFFCFFSIR